MIAQLLFLLLSVTAIGVFVRNIRKVIRNIRLGRPTDRSDRSGERWITMLRVALGQSKMVVRPVAGVFHIFVYVGFVIINLEVMEIIIDGLFGTHRVFSFIGPAYDFLIASFEVLAFLVLVGVVVFLLRREVIRLRRFTMPELKGWPRTDATIILVTEILLMSAFLCMNAADSLLQERGIEHYIAAGAFPVSSWLIPCFSDWSDTALILLERGCWWFHIIGIFIFLNYLPYSKHLHIFLSFPNTYYSNLDPKGKFSNMDSVTREVKLMLDPSSVPSDAGAPGRFGAKDVRDLTWKQLMDAYSCTECGRCTSVCPANLTGKALSPRKVMMDTRDRLDEVGKGIDQKGLDFDDGKSLLDRISEEEIWACTSCNACTDACPVNIDPLSIIMDVRRYLVM
ncbi:MAG: 4Fe-4S dicluster domain-containing protein, partial [Bacteroidota bacterium]